jgi:hypothetical protein
MKRLQALIWLVFLILLQCTGGDSGSGTSDNTDIDENSYSLLATSEIGPTGGFIDAGDIIFEIPDSAFSTTTTLAIYHSSEKTDVGADGCSDLYFIEGLPESFDGTITVSIALTKSLVETGYIAVSRAPFEQELGNHEAAPILIEAIESSGYLIGEWSLPAGVSAMSTLNHRAPSNQNLKRYFQAWMNRKPKKTISHFAYHWPASIDANTKTSIQADLEQAYDEITDRGLDTSKITWPMPIHAWRFESGLEDRYCVFLMPEPGVFVLAFDETKLIDSFANGLEIRAALMRELFHAVTASGDPAYFIQDSHADLNRYWFHHAFSSYAEGWLGYAHDEHPIDYEDSNESIQAPIKGMVAGRGTTFRESIMHGGGMSAMAKYIVDNYQESILLDISSEISAGSHPVKALIDAVAPYNTLNEWYLDFMKEYARGAVYAYSYSSLYDIQTWSIDNTNDTTHSFDLAVPDLGARACEIYLYESAIDEVTFTLTSSQVANDDMEVIVLGDLHTQNDPYLTSAGQKVTVSNIKLLRSQGVTSLFVFVVNAGEHPPTYNQSGTINLKVDAKMQATDSDCSEAYEEYHELEMTLNRYCGFGSEGGLLCSRYGFSGCANACVNTDKYPPSASSVFNLWNCSSYSGYASCASSAFSAYVGCLEACNADFLAGEWGTEWGVEYYILHNVCAPECQDQVNQVLNDQCAAE